MNQKKSKWRIILPIFLVVAIIASVAAFGFYRAGKKKVLVNLAEVQKGDVVKTFSTSAPVKSNSSSVFYAIDGVKVVNLNVKEGDIVEAGAVLATFDTSPLSEKLEEMQRAAESAQTAYTDSIKAAESAKTALPSIISEIEKLESEEGTEKVEEAKPSSSLINDIVGSLLGGMLGSDMGISGMFGDDFASKSQLAQLQIQKIVLETQMSDTYLNSIKEKRDVAQKSLNIFNNQLSLLKNGWVAEKRGIVSKLNIKAGTTFVASESNGGAGGLDLSVIMGMLSGDADLSSLMSMFSGGSDLSSLISMFTGSSSSSDLAASIGIVIENYDEFFAPFSLGKYDMETVKLGQKAVVSFVDREYNAEVTYISPTASASDSFNITSMMGGMAGSTSAAEGIVTIFSPDEGIILGFDADISIITDEAFDVLILPVESIRWTPEGDATVYTYNEKTKKVTLREIEVGISDATGIEILGGLEEGDKVVRNVLSGSSKMLENDLKVKISS